jgi:hypothetical protein
MRFDPHRLSGEHEQWAGQAADLLKGAEQLNA